MPAADEYTSTTNYSLKKPIDGQAQDAWGVMINEDLDTLDTTLDTMQTDIDSKAPASDPIVFSIALG
jgi:hypothetical protein